MSKVINIAKYTAAFLVIAVGFSLIFGTLMGGGSSRGYDAAKRLNDDPRSIFVQTVLIETDASVPIPDGISRANEQLSEQDFAAMLESVSQLRGVEGARVRTPAMLIQHAESGALSVRLGDRVFDAELSPSVIDTKKGPVLRIALQIRRADSDSSSSQRALSFSTAFTTAPGGAIVLDLADLGIEGTHALLALRTTLLDPTPTANN
jgi:hypothetical protein